jgi:subtilase family serine protease
LAAGDTVTLSFSIEGDVIIDLPGPINNVTGGQMSMFSTWNPSNENDIKPVVSAPGGNILSTYLSSQGGYNILSGTSMATPFIAGVVALYKQAKGKGVSPLVINAALAATAKPLNLNDGTTNSYPFLTSVAQQGGGLVDAYHMVHAGVAVTEVSRNFSCYRFPF